MGAAMIAPLLGSVVSSLFAPPAPQPTIIEPPPVQPSLTADNATKIAQATEQKGTEFGQQLLNSILQKAKDQGTGGKELDSIKSEFNNWYAQNTGDITKSLGLMAAHSQAQADYQNAIQNNAFNAKLQALQATTPQGGGLGKLVGGLASGMLGGMGGGLDMSGGFSSPTMMSGPDDFTYSA